MFQYSQGKHTTQGHKGIPQGHFEEEQGRRGFFGPVSHLIKPEPSTRWNQIEGNLRPHLFDLVKLDKAYGKFQRLLYNSDTRLSYLWMQKSTSAADWAWRNANGDTLYFCHSGEGQILTEYGLLSFKRGSYVVMPKCMHHTFHFKEETCFLVIESFSGPYREPDRGMAGRNAFYDLAAIGKPDLEAQYDFKNKNNFKVTKIFVDREAEGTTVFSYNKCVYDTVGWKGDYFPFTLHINDLMPLNSHRVHLPPSAHTTFAANGFVVCTFLPRPFETDEDALKVPFYHQNIDYDEVLFYHDGDFFSRDNLHSGMITLHPAGFPHGPHPKAFNKVNSKSHTDEVAVMIDTWNPLKVDPEFLKVEVKDYWSSWMK
jgi:homogentisate 1,2-dioxygenase